MNNIKTFPSLFILFYKFNEFQCRMRFCLLQGVFLHPGKIHALNGRSDSTPRKLTLKFPSPISNINVDVSFVKQQKIKK